MFYLLGYVLIGLVVAYPLDARFTVKTWLAPKGFVILTWPLLIVFLILTFVLGYGRITWNNKVKYKGPNYRK